MGRGGQCVSSLDSRPPHGADWSSGAAGGRVLPALRASRNRVNGGGGDWLFAPDSHSAPHAQTVARPALAGSRLLIASDGFLALAADYARYTPGGLLSAACMRGLRPLSEELRAIEAGDPVGRIHPRFKTSDDATAMLLSIAI